MDFTRGGFIGAAAAAFAGCSTLRSPAKAPRLDPTLAVLFSDVHVGGRDDDPTRQYEKFSQCVEEILAMRPLPAQAIMFGDTAYLFGRACDYARSAPLFQRLSEAGIKLTFGMGNHDHREAFFAQYPEELKRTLVPGYAVFEVNFPDVDLLMLDSLWEDRSGPETYNPVCGILDRPVWDFLAKDLPARTKPVILGAHHPYAELRITDEPNPDPKREKSIRWTVLRQLVESAPAVKGYIHGHDHRWYTDFMRFGYAGPHAHRIVRSVGLPSTGHWGDIGYSILRTAPGRATVELHEKEFFFPDPEAGHPEWDAALADNRNARVTFAW